MHVRVISLSMSQWIYFVKLVMSMPMNNPANRNQASDDTHSVRKSEVTII
jgi:hypothetical protein